MHIYYSTFVYVCKVNSTIIEIFPRERSMLHFPQVSKSNIEFIEPDSLMANERCRRHRTSVCACVGKQSIPIRAFIIINIIQIYLPFTLSMILNKRLLECVNFHWVRSCNIALKPV